MQSEKSREIETDFFRNVMVGAGRSNLARRGHKHVGRSAAPRWKRHTRRLGAESGAAALGLRASESLVDAVVLLQ